MPNGDPSRRPASATRIVPLLAGVLLASTWTETSNLAHADTPSGSPGNATVPGEVSLPAPTRHHLSIEWPIQGDDNLDGTVSVRFRAIGDSVWRQGMPLRRIPAGSNPAVGRSWGNRHSGSLFGLTPDTGYEIELDLSDPDGGSAQRLVQASTLPIPQSSTNGGVHVATPATLATVLGQAEAGDIIELAPGTYSGFQINRDGAPGQPLTLRGTPGAVISGELGLFFRAHWILQSLTVHGRIRFNGSDDIAIIDCTVQARASLGPTVK